MTVSYPIPENLGSPTKVSEPKEIAKLKGDPIRGKLKQENVTFVIRSKGGVPFGPELTHWGKERTIEEIVKEIVYPDAKLAHGYEKPVRLSSKKPVRWRRAFYRTTVGTPARSNSR